VEERQAPALVPGEEAQAVPPALGQKAQEEPRGQVVPQALQADRPLPSYTSERRGQVVMQVIGLNWKALLALHQAASPILEELRDRVGL